MTKQPDIEHPTAENAKPAHETWRILFVDKADNVEQLKGACKKVGYVVIGATRLEDAWAFIEGKDHVDVIVCAAHLENESMLSFLRDVRENEIHRDSMFLILSLEPGVAAARVERSTERAGIALGADGYLVMPVFDASELVAQIQKLQPQVPRLQQSTTAKERREAE